MESTVAVMRKTGGKTTGADGFEVDEWATVYAAADFRLGGANQGSTGSRTLNVGGVDVQVGVRVGNFAYDTTDLADGDLIEVTAGENDGLVLRIVEADWQDQATARRVPVVATERPGEWA
jgi:hypothetical protein